MSGRENDPLLPYLSRALALAATADIAVGFLMSSGLDRIEPHLRDLLRRGGRLRLLTPRHLVPRTLAWTGGLLVTDPDLLWHTKARYSRAPEGNPEIITLTRYLLGAILG